MQVILKPLINEKSMNLVKSDLYTFVVHSNATKHSVSDAVAEKFKVKVLSVSIINLTGKKKSQRTRRGYFSTPGIKKALVRVGKGQKIPIFETSSASEEVEVRTAEGETVTKVKESKSLFKDTKVKIEKTREANVIDKEKEATQNDSKRPTKTSQKEAKKG